MRRSLAPRLAVTLAVLSLAACSDAPTSAPRAVRGNQSEGRGTFQRYVAIGTSISMGVASDGVLARSQRDAWPAQLARLAHRDLPLPLIQAPGCGAPLVGPISTNLRESGEPASVSATCAPNEAGVQLSTGNVAMDGARTSEALTGTPESVGATNPFRGERLSRVLAPGMTQVTSMMAQNPKFVSVELGANELLGARSGLVIPGLTTVPFAVWAPIYTAIVDSVAAIGADAVLVGLVADARNVPAFRSGDEIWNARTEFLGFGVIVSSNCQASANTLFVPVLVPTIIGRAAATRQPQVLSCADVPGTQDFILTPGDVAAVNAQFVQMSEFIRTLAAQHGYAYFELDALYGRPDLKAPYSVRQQLFSPEPYGPFISLDGYHPSAAGQALLAAAAARAINARYDLSLPVE